MKAMILAAGLGTRLRPHTRIIPKVLFPIGGRPLLDITIGRLVEAGCEAVMINTHHLHDKIEAFLAERSYPVPVTTRREPRILGTGGAIKNVADFWDHRPFLVVNGDILFDIDLKMVYDFHCRHRPLATLVLCPCEGLDSVQVDHQNNVTGFDEGSLHAATGCGRRLTFTGIQVLDPAILALMPAGRFSSSIDAFRRAIARKQKVIAFIADHGSWTDIGTPQRYRQAALAVDKPRAFRRAFPGYRDQSIACIPLAGDGSQRKWYRLSSRPGSLVMVDHGIRSSEGPTEVDAFVDIGTHLLEAGIPVPRIHLADRFAGLVFLQDLGDRNLQDEIRRLGAADRIHSCYRRLLPLVYDLSRRGAESFDTGWTYQSPRYDEKLILKKECGYFVEAFLRTTLGLEVKYTEFAAEFEHLAQNALRYAAWGFMHRDLQSRNIMIKDGRFYFIDFQGGRLGPLQYDLAALLIDPYVDLDVALRERLLNEFADAYAAKLGLGADEFRFSYRYCALARNLQILGAFGHLSTVAGKTHFRCYIPPALRSLKTNLAACPGLSAGPLAALVEKIAGTRIRPPAGQGGQQ